MTTILGYIAKPLGFLLNLLYDFIGEYGVAIILLTIIVKLCLYPLYIKQTKSMARMTAIQPKLKALQQKYANDRKMQQLKIAELQKEEKFNPAGGCLPMLIQMPIIMGLFFLLRNPITFMGGSMLFAVHDQFLWIQDLSQPDQWILPIAAGIGTFISMSLNKSSAPDGSGNQMGGMMKAMKYVFPFMIVWLGRSFPAGLALYWAVGQAMQIGFNLHMNKIREKINEENKNKKRR